MRVLGAQSLRAISELDLTNLGPENSVRAVWGLHHYGVRDSLIASQAKLLSYPDVSEIHGGLVALTELASGFKTHGLEQERQQVRTYSPDSRKGANYCLGVSLSRKCFDGGITERTQRDHFGRSV